jgi:hypothetical protein
MTDVRELEDLVGSELSGICFVRDYVELHFDGAILRSLSEPIVVMQSSQWRFPEEGSRDALCRLIGRVVDNAAEHPDRLEISFGTSAAVEIPKASHDAGPEIAHLVPSRGGRLDAATMITWENLQPTRGSADEL